MQNPQTVQYITKDDLQRIRALETDEFRFNQFLTDEYIERLDPTVKLPVVHVFAHEQSGGPYKTVMRCLVVLPVHGQHTRDGEELGNGVIDMPIEEYLSLPAVSV